jgi:hypothetical protein
MLSGSLVGFGKPALSLSYSLIESFNFSNFKYSAFIKKAVVPRAPNTYSRVG